MSSFSPFVSSARLICFLDHSPKNTYCMICALRSVMMEAYSKSHHAITPYQVITKLQGAFRKPPFVRARPSYPGSDRQTHAERAARRFT